MKPRRKRIWFILIIIAAFLLLFSLPYTIPFVFGTEYTDGEVLGFYGNIVGAAATIVAVVSTILFTLKNQRAKRKEEIKPLLQIESISSPETYGFNESFYGNEYFILYLNDKNGIIGSYDYPRLIGCELKGEQFADSIQLLSRSRETLLFRTMVSNAGGDNAVSIKLKLNKQPVYCNFSIPAGGNKMLVFIFGKDLLVEGKCTIEFTYKYRDVSAIAYYEQREYLNLKADEEGFLECYQISDDFLSEPKEITKTEFNM